MVRRYFLFGLMVIAAFSIIVGLSGCSSSSGGPPPEPPPPATDIKGMVFHDADGNGVKGADEQGIVGILVSNGSASTATDQNGNYTLPKTGSFIFVTTPSDYTPSGAWYRSISDSQFSFGLTSAPEKETAQFTFVHMTDIHLDGDSLATLNQAVEEIQGISPAFVMASGDFVNVGDKR